MAAKSKTTKAPEQEAPAAGQPQSFRSYNRVQLAGRLVADPDLKYTSSGKAVCRMRLATNDTKVAQFHDIVAWEAIAQTAAETRGSPSSLSQRRRTLSASISIDWEASGESHAHSMVRRRGRRGRCLLGHQGRRHHGHGRSA